MAQRFPKPTHTTGVSILVPHSKFTPTPTMSPLVVAFHKGREARRLNRPPADNPHDGALAQEWDKGYQS